jgi:hypothetical protein
MVTEPACTVEEKYDDFLKMEEWEEDDAELELV